MATLVISVPNRKVCTGSDSFEMILQNGLGKGFIIYKRYKDSLPPGSGVVVLRKGRNKSRAEGTLVKLKESGKADNGQMRYDVHFTGAKLVPYKDERLDRSGTTVI